MSECIICHAVEHGTWENNPLHNGLCEDCLAWLYDHHRTECHTWYVNEVCENDESCDLTETGARKWCLWFSPNDFSEWLVTEHTDWLARGMKVVRDNTWRWLTTLDRFQ